MEIAEEINDVLKTRNLNLSRIESTIVDTHEPQIVEINRIAEDISCMTGLQYMGIDFSLAPLPKENNSVVSILNAIGVKSIDDAGVIFATAYLARILKTFSSKFKSVGFSGVMYSLIEDKVYAEDNNSRGCSIDRM